MNKPKLNYRSTFNNGYQYERELDFLRHETMDPVRDRLHIEELRKQAEEGKLEEIETENKNKVPIAESGIVNLQVEGDTKLIAACKAGNLSIVKELIEAGADVNLRSEWETPLTAACKAGNLSIVKELIEVGADVHLRSEWETPLTAAFEGGHMSVVRELIQAGADVNPQSKSETPLATACKAGKLMVVKRMIEKGFYVNPEGKSETPLTAACKAGNLIVVKELIKVGADVNLRSEWETPLTAAYKAGNLSIAKELIKVGADVNLRSESGTPLTVACKAGNLSIVKELIEVGVDVNLQSESGTPLTVACKAGNLSIVKELIKVGADVNLRSESGTPLTVACQSGNLSVVKVLIEAGADVNERGVYDTPLTAALRGGYMDVVKKLVEAGATVTNEVTEAIPKERFMEYMKNGKTTVRHARGIVVGCAGAGKTTLLYRLIGKSPDEIKEIKSTRGLHVYEHIFLVKNSSLFATKKEDLKKRLIRIPVYALEKNERLRDDESMNEKVDDSVNEKDERESGNSASLESVQTDMRAGKEFKAKQNATLVPRKYGTNDQKLAQDERRAIADTRKDETKVQQLAQDAMKEILDARETETSVSMIDFAGQFAYYACHQIYMRSEAFYILVLDMTKAFQDVVDGETDECQDAIFSKWSYKDYLHYWLDSIKSFGGTSAQVLAVATHTERKTEEEKESFWESLWKKVPQEDKIWLQKSVGAKEFALELKEMNEEEKLSLEYLKNSIVEVVSQGLDTKIEVPSAWALLEHLLQKKEKPILSIDDISNVNKELPDEYQLKSQEEIIDFLSFFHGHGMLLFFKEEGLRTHAILGIQWFSNAFSKLIAEKSHINRDCKRKYISEWDCFNATGNLSNSLVNALWKDEPSYEEHKTALMSYMERLRMLVNIGESDGEISWYVPCMNKKCFTYDVLKQKMEKSSILCFRFKSFAMFVYYRLIAHCMSFFKWSVSSDGKGSQCLYHTSAIFETEQNHTVIVGISDNDIQVQILRINTLQPKVSCEIGRSIEMALTELTKTFDEKKTFQKGYKCLNIFCSQEDLTFIPENKLCGIQCNCPIGDKHEIDVQWTLGFWEEEMAKSVCTKSTVSSGKNLDGRTRFAKQGMAIIDVLTQTCRDVLEKEIPPSDIFVKASSTKRYKDLSPKQKNLLQDAPNSGYKKFDITLLYTVIRTLCLKSPTCNPTHGWGLKAMPAAGEITVGDDVERIRLIRNEVYGHVSSASTSQAEFDTNWSIISEICKRLETYTGKSYLDGLDNIKELSLKDSREAIIEQIKSERKHEKEIHKKLDSMGIRIHKIESNMNLRTAHMEDNATSKKRDGHDRRRCIICRIL